MVGGGEDELGGGGAVGEGGEEGGGCGEGCGDAGDNLERDAGFAEGSDLFSSATEDEGVSGLEAEYGTAGLTVFGAGVVDHEGVDLGLGDTGLAAALSDGDDGSGGAGEIKDFVGDEIVGEDDIAGAEEVRCAQGEEIGVPWACAYEVDGAGLRFRVHCWALSLDCGRGLVRACSRARVREGH